MLQRLARLATVAPDGQPDVVPVGFEFDGTHLYVGGMAPARTRTPSSCSSQANSGRAPYLQITPTISWSFNLNGHSFTHDREVIPCRTVHHAADPAPSPPAPRAPVE